MRPRSRVAPREAELDRGSRIGSSKEIDRDARELFFAIPQVDGADVSVEIDGGGFDENRFAGVEAGAVFGTGDRHACSAKAIIADEYRSAFVRGIDLEIVAGRQRSGGRTIRKSCHQRFD